MSDRESDLIVAGQGNAASCSTLSAHENEAKVVTLERTPESETGDDPWFTAGGFRLVLEGLEGTCKDVLVNVAEQEKTRITLRGDDRQFFFDQTMGFDAACGYEPYSPSILDGTSTCGIFLPESNRVFPINQPPSTTGLVSPLVVCTSTSGVTCKTWQTSRSPGFTQLVNWLAGCFKTTTRVAPA